MHHEVERQVTVKVQLLKHILSTTSLMSLANTD